MNPAEWLSRTATRQPDAPALLKGARVDADYREFARRAAGVGAGLTGELGVKPGDRVAIFAANCTEYLEAFYGIWWAGAVAVPINAKLHAREAAWIIANSGTVAVFADHGTSAALADAGVEGVREIVDLGSERHLALRDRPGTPAPAIIDTGDIAWLFYTSGTTGRPKGVMITAGNLAAMTYAYFVDVDEVRQDDAALYAAPMSHGAGIYNFMHVLRGARHVVPDSAGFDAAEIAELAPRIGNVSMFAAPTMVRRLVDHAARTGWKGEGIRNIVYGGGPMYVADIVEAVERMGPRFIQIYGQGESPMAITALSRSHVADRSHPRWRERLASVGTAQSCVLVKVGDEEGRELPRGEIGEIMVRGATVMKGYWDNPEATADTVRDGWLRTGDVGRMDEEGFLTLQDRSKDMIISGGTNIYPREVEEALLQHEAVHEAAVVGRPSREWGEDVVAFVVAADGASLDAGALDAHCLDRIARFKRPKDYRFVAELPKNNYGKVLKTELRRLLAEG